ncbi:MAG: HD domain-containing protein [Planctomycetota bacterium]
MTKLECPPGGTRDPLRRFLLASREAAATLHRKGAPGRRVGVCLAAGRDRLVRRALASVGGVGGIPFSVLATGSYGRRELCSFSDTDLLILHHAADTASAAAAVGPFLAKLWDAGLDVGHAVHTPETAAEAMRQDAGFAAAVTDARLVAGDAIFARGLTGEIIPAFFSGCGTAFARWILEGMRVRQERSGGSVRVQEPDLKEGAGGLRDLQSVRWLSRVTGDVRMEEGLPAAVDFLLRVRQGLHGVAGRRDDRLALEYQPAVAKGLGYADRGGRLAAERLMPDVRRATEEIRRRLVERVERIQLDPNFFPSVRASLRRRPLGGGLVDVGGLLFPGPDSEKSARGWEAVLGTFRTMQRLKLGMSAALRRDIQRSTGRAGRPSREPGAVFLDILRGREHLFATLSAMRDTGALGAFLPEFGALEGLSQYDRYHAFTADEHALLAVKWLEETAREPAPGEEAFQEAIRRSGRWETLVLAALLHDCGKARGKDHARRGARLVPAVAVRLGLSPEDAVTLRFLVGHHLEMADLSQRRDVSDDRVIRRFAKLAETRERLDELYLITAADLHAVSRAAWTGWKAAVLAELHGKAAICLAEREELREGQREGRLTAGLLREAYPERSVREHLTRMPPDYWRWVSVGDAGLHLDLIARLAHLPFAAARVEKAGFWDITVVARDRLGLFADITGALAAAGAGIQAARVMTRDDGIVVDVFSAVPDPRDGDPEGVWRRFERDLKRVLAGEVKAADLVVRRRRRFFECPRADIGTTPPEVRAENGIPGRCTLLEVLGQDRPCLLHDIAASLSKAGMDIHYAKIATTVDRAADVFYVTDRKGKKLSRERIAEVCAAVRAVV